MFSHQVNRKDADKVFTVVHNVNGDVMTTGVGVRYVGGVVGEVVSTDGIQCVKTSATAGDFSNFAGIASQDIADNDYGLVQNWGYVDSIMMSNEGTSITCGIFDGDRPLNLAGGLFTSHHPTGQALSTYGWKYVQQWDTVGVSGLAWAKGFVRAI